MFDHSKLESLRYVNITRISDTFPHGFPQTVYVLRASDKMQIDNNLIKTQIRYLVCTRGLGIREVCEVKNFDKLLFKISKILEKIKCKMLL